MRDRIDDEDLEPARPTLLPRALEREAPPPPEPRAAEGWRRSVPATRSFPRGGARDAG